MNEIAKKYVPGARDANLLKKKYVSGAQDFLRRNVVRPERYRIGRILSETRTGGPGARILSDGNPKGGFASEGQCDDACQRAYGRPISSSNRSPLIQNYPMGVFLCALAFTSLLWLSDNIRCL